jgi:hypothetical protein
VQDPTQYAAVKTFTIAVLNSNDPPEFLDTTLAVEAADVVAGGELGTVQASDPDGM